MTDKEKLNAIKAEVQNYIDAAHKAHTNITDGNFAHLLSFIDSLQEEPVSEDFETEWKCYCDAKGGGAITVNVKELARHFAAWQKEQIEKVLLSEVLPCFMHGGEADEVVAKLDEVLNQKK